MRRGEILWDSFAFLFNRLEQNQCRKENSKRVELLRTFALQREAAMSNASALCLFF